MAEDKKKKQQLNLKYLLVTRKYLLISIGLSLVSIIIFFTFVFPRVQSIQAARQELREGQEKLTTLKQKLSTLQIVNDLDAYQERETINAILPSYKPLLPLIAGFEQIATDNTLIVSTFDIAPGEISTASGETAQVRSTKSQEQTIESMFVQTSVIGTVDNLNSFLEDLDTMAPLTEVSTISLSPLRRAITPDETNPQFAFEAQLSLVTYFYSDKPVITATQKLPELATITDAVLPEIQKFRVNTTPVVPSQIEPIETGREGLF